MGKNQPVMVEVFNSGYLIALLLFLAGSVGSFCDGVIASKGLGVAELAAVGLVYPYTKSMECISLLFSSGSQIIIGHKIGRNEFGEVSKVFYTSLAFTACLAVAIAVAAIAAANPVSTMFGASEAGGTLAPTADYLVSLAVGAPAQLLTLYMIPLYQLDEENKLVRVAMTAMIVVNVGLNVLFLMCGMGIKGIGYSTSISNYVALLILSTHLFKGGKGILLQGGFRVSGACLVETIREGAPSAFKNVTSIVFNGSVNNIIATVGSTEALAAFSVFKTTKFIFLSVSEAIINPVRMIQSMLHEERDLNMLRTIFGYSIARGLVLSVALSALIWIFGREIYSLMVTGAVLDETVSLMKWATVVFVLNTFVCYYLAYFQAINRNGIVYSISVVLNVATLPVFYLLGEAFGSQGVWMGLAVQFVVVTAYVIGLALVMGRGNKGLVGKLLVVSAESAEGFDAYDFHIGSVGDAEKAVEDFGRICERGIAESRKSYFCSLALEEIVFNIIEYQKSAGESKPNIDVHIIIYGKGKMVMRVKDCSKERNPFVKYEYSGVGDDFENLGIKILKSIAVDIKYSFVYGVNFITITV